MPRLRGEPARRTRQPASRAGRGFDGGCRVSRVLLVDDEPTITRALSRLLRRAGFEVESANDPGVALEMLRVASFDVVISDERMPGGSGVDFLETCAREWPSMVRVLPAGMAADDPQTTGSYLSFCIGAGVAPSRGMTTTTITRGCRGFAPNARHRDESNDHATIARARARGVARPPCRTDASEGGRT